MSIKVIGTGNILMGDDGIGVIVARKIAGILTEKNIEVIVAETDIDYCLSKISCEDFVFVLDACLLQNCGEIILIPLENLNTDMDCFTQHGLSILSILPLYKIKGVAICIGVEDIKPDLNLSELLEKKLNMISEYVFNIILETVKKL